MISNLKTFWGRYFYCCVMHSKWSTTLLLLISNLELGSLTAQKPETLLLWLDWMMTDATAIGYHRSRFSDFEPWVPIHYRGGSFGATVRHDFNTPTAAALCQTQAYFHDYLFPPVSSIQNRVSHSLAHFSQGYLNLG